MVIRCKFLNIVIIGILLFTVHCSLFTVFCDAELIDRVVAYVDDQAITLSEFQQEHKNTQKITSNSSEEDVINVMINRKLLLRDAKKYRIEAPSEEEIIREYINLKVRAFITVGESDIEEFYKSNVDKFKGKDYEVVRDEIEEYLTEKELNEMLKKMLDELRKNAYIKVQLKTE